ncbi:hypothetical protein M408DRAFT_28002 [Serendipita vermifera MAFF 305830]|uniref:Uncharacterized protein n=1 Tax=Serendipita vermifera MAFF 305830 TaxID=933852 RepID=A0A0C2X1C8_SERVB|nr:hypothetical protein M408DRAFT_28002 [Serendipita vermifera MAFF 305830]
MASKRDPLAELEGVAQCEELNAMFKSAFSSLQLIEPWREANIDHPRLQQIIQKIQGYTTVYFEAIRTSINTSQDGYWFSCDALELSSYLLDPETGPNDFQEYIEEMKIKANAAYRDSMTTLNKFRDVRKGLTEITKSIPREALVVPDGILEPFNRLLASQMGGERGFSLEIAIKEHKLEVLDMDKLLDDVDKFADWWSRKGLMLKAAERNASDLRSCKERLRVDMMQKRYTRIRDEYKQYEVQASLRLSIITDRFNDIYILQLFSFGAIIHKVRKLSRQKIQRDMIYLTREYKPNLGKTVTELGEDVYRMMLSLHEFQKALGGTNSSSFARVRKELKDQWEILRTCLQKCQKFALGVATIKNGFKEATRADLTNFLDSMRASAGEIQGISSTLKKFDMSSAFSKGRNSDGSATEIILFSTEGLQNDNLKSFVIDLMGVNKSLSEMDMALLRIKASIDILSQFWDNIYKRCDHLVKRLRVSRVPVETSIAKHTSVTWCNYREAIDKAVTSITNTHHAILMELCNYILDPDLSQNDRQDFSSGLERDSETSRDSFSETLARFADIRQSLNTFVDHIPKEVILNDRDFSRYFTRFYALSSSGANQGDSRVDVAIAGLRCEVSDMTTLSKAIDKFKRWCKEVEGTMKMAECSVNALSTEGSSEGGEQLRTAWGSVLKEYEYYKSLIVKIHDHWLEDISAATPNALASLEVSSPRRILNSIVYNAFKCMQIIEPWRRASSNNPALSKVILDICQFSSNYYDAIDISIDTAQNGYQFSDDVIELCGFLLNETIDIEELREYIDDMKSKAQDAWEECTAALTKFRKVRQDLLEIMKRVPKEVLEVDTTKPSIRIPCFGEQAGEERDMGLVDAVSELDLAIIDLGTLSTSVDRFVNWWADMETVLRNMEEKGSDLQPKKNKLRVRQLRKTWTGVREDYKQYKKKIIQLQDYYSSQLSDS